VEFPNGGSAGGRFALSLYTAENHLFVSGTSFIGRSRPVQTFASGQPSTFGQVVALQAVLQVGVGSALGARLSRGEAAGQAPRPGSQHHEALAHLFGAGLFGGHVVEVYAA
jgi:hypothetical protein